MLSSVQAAPDSVQEAITVNSSNETSSFDDHEDAFDEGEQFDIADEESHATFEDEEEETSWRDYLTYFMARSQHLLSRYRHPLMFAFITAAGPRVASIVGGISASVVTAKQAHKILDRAVVSHRTQRNPYPPPPQWMRESRAAIPRAFEASVSAVLSVFGIPTYSELQALQLEKRLDPAEVTPGADGENCGGGLPHTLLIPLATAIIVLVAKYVIAANTRRSCRHSEDECSERVATTSAPGIPIVPSVDMRVVEKHASAKKRNNNISATTPRSTASSEPTHGVRTTDPERVTPRTSMLRINSEALTGSIRKHQLPLDGRHPIPELDERVVATPQRPTTIDSNELSPPRIGAFSVGRTEGSSPLALGLSTNHLVFLAFSAPVTQQEVLAAIACATKYGVPNIIIKTARRNATNTSGLSFGFGDNSASSVKVVEVDDVASHCRQVALSLGIEIVGVTCNASSTRYPTTPVHQSEHSVKGAIYCFDPVQCEEARRGRATAPACQDLCDRWIDLHGESAVLKEGLANVVSVCLFARYKKLVDVDGNDV